MRLRRAIARLIVNELETGRRRAMTATTSRAIAEALSEAEQQRPYGDRVWEVVRELGKALPPGRLTCHLRRDGSIPIFVAAADGKPVAQLELTKHDGWVLVQHRPEHLRPMVLGHHCLQNIVWRVSELVELMGSGSDFIHPTRTVWPPLADDAATLGASEVVGAFVEGFHAGSASSEHHEGQTLHHVSIKSRDGKRKAASVFFHEGGKPQYLHLTGLPSPGGIRVALFAPGGGCEVVACGQDLEHAIRLVRIWLYWEQRDFTRQEVDREDHQQHERELFGGDR